jgi:hypothetical protein
MVEVERWIYLPEFGDISDRLNLPYRCHVLTTVGSVR